MTRTFETECANCGDDVEVDLSNDPGADRYSLQGRDHYCDSSCRWGDN